VTTMSTPRTHVLRVITLGSGRTSGTDELAQTISLGSGGNGEEGQDWVLTYISEKRDSDDREKVLVRLTPCALHELYIDVMDLDVETRQRGHRAECEFCGRMVDMKRAISNSQTRRLFGADNQLLPLTRRIK